MQYRATTDSGPGDAGPVEIQVSVRPASYPVTSDSHAPLLALRPPPRTAACLCAYIYFARPDSRLHGAALHAIRVRQGRELASESPADADIVIPVPDSAVPAAIGFAQESGIPYSEGLIKNRYIGRTFIEPTDRMRKVGISLKFTALPDNFDLAALKIDPRIGKPAEAMKYLTRAIEINTARRATNASLRNLVDATRADGRFAALHSLPDYQKLGPPK